MYRLYRPRVTRRNFPMLALLALSVGLVLSLLFAALSGAGKASAAGIAAQDDTFTVPPPVATDPPSLTATRTATVTPGGPTFTPTNTSTSTPTPPAECWRSWTLSWPIDHPGTPNVLMDVAAVSPGNIWAVGYYTETGRYRTLIENWNGAGWRIMPSPNLSEYNNFLTSIFALNASDMWVTGYRVVVPSTAVRPFTLHWDGANWNTVPLTGFICCRLNDVLALAQNDVWAVGDSIPFAGAPDKEAPDGAYDAYIVHWNGSAWSQVSSPRGGTANTLFGLSAVAANDIWAVGYDTFNALIEHWDGTQWSIVPNPAPANSAVLYNVAAVSHNDVWAVGYTFGDTAAQLVLHWNGTAWSSIPQPNVGMGAILSGITAVAPNNIWAVGSYVPTGSTRQSLVEHWDGFGWSQVPVSASAGQESSLIAVSAASARDVWAVGGYGVFPTDHTLAAHYSERFTDVNTTDYYYNAVQYLDCMGVISGYADGTFRPGNSATRAQLTKIVVLAERWPINTTGGPHFSDVPATNPFYAFIETAYHHGVISGYADGTFRWGNPVTRGQLTKIIVQAEGWSINTAGGPHFSDVPTTNPFYTVIETAYNRGVISGYADGTFRWGNNATRGQLSKIVYTALIQPGK